MIFQKEIGSLPVESLRTVTVLGAEGAFETGQLQYLLGHCPSQSLE